MDSGEKDFVHVFVSVFSPAFLVELRRLSRGTASEQCKWSENSAWYQDASRRAVILVCNPDNGNGDILETDAGFVWVEVAGLRLYSCYFSPNDPFEGFETQIVLLEESLSEARWRTLIAGDSNNMSPE